MTPQALDAAFAALADPTRRAILLRLAQEEVSVMDLAKPFAMSQPAISKHLKVLENAGLVSRGRDGARRPVKVELAAFSGVINWLENYREMWRNRFDALDSLLDELKAAAGADEPKPPQS